MTVGVWEQSRGVWRCAFCGATFQHVNSIRYHLDAVHGIPWTTVAQVATPGGTYLEDEPHTRREAS